MATKRDWGKGTREAYWRKHVQARERSGRSVREYCRARGVSESGFYFWKRELKRRDERAASSGNAPVFAEVRVAAAQEALIEIAFAGTRRIQVHPGFDEETLARVLAVLERAGAPEAHAC